MTLICGLDEAGRGPLCGPVFASAVILDNNLKIKNQCYRFKIDLITLLF